MQVNGNLVSPTHVLANAEVVEIITYDVSIYKFSYCNFLFIEHNLCDVHNSLSIITFRKKLGEREREREREFLQYDLANCYFNYLLCS